MTTILSAKNISKAFKGKQVLENLDFELEENQIVAICGTNGSGKSVFMRILAGLVVPDSGTVTINGVQLGGKVEFPNSTGVHFDNSGLLLTETAKNNLLLLAMVSNTVSKERVEEVIRWLVWIRMTNACPHLFHRNAPAFGHRSGIDRRPKLIDVGRTDHRTGFRRARLVPRADLAITKGRQNYFDHQP
jgi:ABC-type nitrate/sulfonate/bicarbonate transport system ATPase subunit